MLQIIFKVLIKLLNKLKYSLSKSRSHMGLESNEGC